MTKIFIFLFFFLEEMGFSENIYPPVEDSGISKGVLNLKILKF